MLQEQTGGMHPISQTTNAPNCYRGTLAQVIGLLLLSTNLKGVKSLCHNEPGAELYPDKTHMLSMGRIML